MLESRSQTPPSTTTPTTPEVPTTTCSPLTTTRSSLGGSQVGGLRLFWSVSQFVLAFLRQTCLTYVCTQILLLPLTRLWSSTCIRALEAPGLYYDACMTFLFVELCCDIFPWVPDLDRTRLRVWLVYDWIGGVTWFVNSTTPGNLISAAKYLVAR